ncbi:hypothetical protein KSS87_004764 [Heliosperma pusillum]|nr:hypothetical protein KSS87_004764 [Heliosperma pusillum]
MVVTSVISNAVHPTFPLKFNHKSLNYLTFTCNNYPSSYYSHPQFLLLRSVRYRRRPPNIALVYAKKTEDDDEGNGNSTQSYEKNSDDSQTHLSTSPDNSVNESRHPEGYVSSVRTVAFCVMAFGAGLGFKDGIGKASEFFAGRGFWEDLEEILERVPIGEKLIIGGNLTDMSVLSRKFKFNNIVGATGVKASTLLDG